MAGTVEGGRKARDENLKRDPYFYHRIGAIGGSRGTTGGFACTDIGQDGLTGKQRARVAGHIGGLRSRKGKRVQSQA